MLSKLEIPVVDGEWILYVVKEVFLMNGILYSGLARLDPKERVYHLQNAKTSIRATIERMQ